MGAGVTLNNCETESDDDALQSFLEPCAIRLNRGLVAVSLAFDDHPLSSTSSWHYPIFMSVGSALLVSRLQNLILMIE